MQHIAVIGDVIVDKYVHATCVRRNDENGARVLRIQSEYFKLGGAAAVARILLGFGCDVSLFSVVGSDEDSKSALSMLQCHGLSGNIQYREGPITTKTRIIVDGKYDSDRIDSDHVLTHKYLVSEKISECDAVVVSDYGRGAVHDNTVSQVRRLYGGPIIIDPCKHRNNWDIYRGATLIKATESEFRAAFPDRQLCDVAREFGDVVVTRGDRGCIFALADGSRFGMVPSENVKCVDSTGAGDTVISVLAFARSLPLGARCQLAMKVAALQVQHIGIEAVPCELDSISMTPSALTES